MLGQLGGILDATLVNLQPGQTSAPIHSLDGYYLLLLRDRRKSQGLAGAEAGSSNTNLQQLFLPLEKNASPAAIAYGRRAWDANRPVLEPGRVHDLRRPARSLLARAGVRPDVGERVMGHAIQGVEGVYDRHQYRNEKAQALRKLAGLIERIVEPAENVVALEAAQ